ncbi:hypothetical protein DDB_G0290403 [Dictyostelium discoideum AX4]|uniref:MRPL25 domain-containing protein n=1 Tax=Dictyostelium discoideum TaxID=44689 RepID=Q54G50_DICDI|nr:hypothetical protein DDB_G0290403 [Dictyostelium discoideum AX4]EAL62217.1 hypothetical protein DDB_G0290403 [Dictyostelium discoideum AX4]|eukprot:XP_635722.1 hypothetical protein DDB_G0290403 [Dictyostelium discoideum AX4]
MSKYIINAEALLKYSNPTKGTNGWIQPKLSTRQIEVFKKHVTRNLKLEWPLPAREKKLNPERTSKLTGWERNLVPRQKKIQESIANMPKLIAEKLKASIEKKKKESDNVFTSFIPNYLPLGPYGNNDTPKVMALRKIAKKEKELKKEKLIALASAKAPKKNKTK